MKTTEFGLLVDCVLDLDSTDLTNSSKSTIFSESNIQNNGTLHIDSRKKNKIPGDRFIPLRTSIDVMVGRNLLQDKENVDQKVPVLASICSQQKAEEPTSYKNKKRILRFNREKVYQPEETALVQDMATKGLIKINKSERKLCKITKKAEKVLDAPGLINDYYLNLLDWGKKNLLAVCLGEGAFVWNASTQEGHQFFTSENPLMIPTSVAWSPVVNQNNSERQPYSSGIQ